MARWRCQNCGDASNAPEKIRKNNVKRYCLPCSELTGKLVERVCIATVSRQAKAATRARMQKAKEEAKTKEALERAKAVVAEEIKKYPWNLYSLFAEWKKLDCWDNPVRLEPLVLEINRKRRGLHSECFVSPDKITLRAGLNVGEAVWRLAWVLGKLGGGVGREVEASMIRFAKQAFNLDIEDPNEEFLFGLRTSGVLSSWARSKKAKFPVPQPPRKKTPPPPKSKLARTIAKRERESEW